jgi:hypothetical protein
MHLSSPPYVLHPHLHFLPQTYNKILLTSSKCLNEYILKSCYCQCTIFMILLNHDVSK